MPKKENIEALFDNIAPSYDKLNHLLSLNIDRTWRRRAAREILDGRNEERKRSSSVTATADVPQNGTSRLRVLDLACGTGDMAIEIARQMKRGGVDGTIIGIDLSENMMSVGREKISRAGFSDLTSLLQGDCENLPYAEGSFDRVTAAFGVRNFEHIELGLSEMRRVLAKGGKVVILELSIPQNKAAARLYRIYFEHILPRVGKIISGDKPAYKYLPASVLNFPAPEKFCGMLRAAGFTEVHHRALSLGICRMYIGCKK